LKSQAGHHNVDCYSGVGFILQLKLQVFSLILYNTDYSANSNDYRHTYKQDVVVALYHV